MKPLKEARTFTEQLAILEERGMVIDDVDAALRMLQQCNYYRFTGYCFQFLNSKSQYKKGTCFEVAASLYRFDQQMRLLLFSALEDIEVFARTQIAYHFSHRHGAGGHYEKSNFDSKEYHDEFLATLHKQIDKNKNATFVAHHCREYGGKMPLWCAVEILPFSSLSKLYSNMRYEDKAVIAKAMGLKEDYLSNWLHGFSVLRNTCAHYGRIYNTFFSPRIRLAPKTLRDYGQIRTDSLFAYIVAMVRMMPRPEQQEKFKEEIINLLDRHASVIELGLIGFPDDWKALLYDIRLFEMR